MLRTLQVQAGRAAGPRRRKGGDEVRGAAGRSRSDRVRLGRGKAADFGRLCFAESPATVAVRSQRSAPATALALPAIPAGVPSRLTAETDARPLGAIAAALLEAGMVTAADWQGDLTRSIEYGLARFLERTFEQGDYLQLQCVLGPTVDLQTAAGLVPGSAYPNEPDNDRPDQGGFAIYAQAWVEGFVGARILQLNEAEPDLGWGVYALLISAFDRTVANINPREIADRMECWLEMDEEVLEDDPDSATGWKRFFEVVPAKARDSYEQIKLRPRALRKAFRRRWQGRFVRRSLSGALEAAARLLEALPVRGEVSLRDDTHDFSTAYEDGIDQDAAVVIRWDPDDLLDAFAEEHHHMLAQGSEETNCVWLAAFDPADPAAVVKAAVRCRRLLEVLALAMRLLNELHTPSPEQTLNDAEAPRVRVRC